ncbi:MAG: cytochrome P450 [Methylococcales bacterium]
MFIDLLRLLTNPTAALTTIHNNHGDFVLAKFFNKKLLFLSNPAHFEEIFSQEARGLLSRDALYDVKKPMFGDGLFNSKTDTWSNQRRLMQPLFTRQAITVWQNIMLQEANSVTERLKNSNSSEINISKEIKETIQKILIQVMFGRSKSDHGDERLMNAIDIIMKGLFPHFVMQTLGKGKLKWLFVLQNRRMEKAVNEFVGYVHTEINRNQNEPAGPDLLSMLIQSKDKTGYTMSKELLKDEAVTLFLAGQDTTVNTLIWFFYLIGRHAEAHKRITDEIQHHAAESLTLENIEKLSYTKAALFETLRLYPQAIALSRDTSGIITIGGESISKNTAIIMSIYATHHDGKRWQRPDEFYPEHFLNRAAAERHKYEFLPFGGGIHNCIGRHFAELEMMLIIVTILKTFKIKCNADIKPTLSLTYKPERDVMVSITSTS